MSKFGANRGGATAPNTLTQYLDIYHQLVAGARWLDIRPVISGGHWFTGHYSGDGNHGANGQGLQDVVSNINKFVSEAQKKELILIRLSNVHNTDLNDPSDTCAKQVTQNQWQDLLAFLQTNTLHLAPNIFSVSDISSMTISQLIQNGPAVIYIIGDSPCDAEKVSLSGFKSAGFIRDFQIPQRGEYSDSDDIKSVKEDQLSKLQTDRVNFNSPMFQLVWTRTKEGINNAGAPFNRWILQDAVDINNQLISSLWPVLTKSRYPNVLLVDALDTYMDVTTLAMAINFQYTPTC